MGTRYNKIEFPEIEKPYKPLYNHKAFGFKKHDTLLIRVDGQNHIVPFGSDRNTFVVPPDLVGKKIEIPLPLQITGFYE